MTKAATPQFQPCPPDVPFGARDLATLDRLKVKGVLRCGHCQHFELHHAVNDRVAYCRAYMLWTYPWEGEGCPKLAVRP